MRGELHEGGLRQTVASLVERHAPLRTARFEMVQGEPVQIIDRELRVEVEQEDLSGYVEEGEREEAAYSRLNEEAQRPYDLRSGPLFRVLVLRMGEQEHILQLGMHHIVSDGWSMGVLVRELTTLYAAFSQGRPSPLPPLRIQYADFARWQRKWLQGEALEKQLSYWRTQLQGAPPALELPADFPVVQQDIPCSASQTFNISETMIKPFIAVCRRHEVTPFMALLAVFKILLHFKSGQEDIVVGTNIANRNRLETEDLIGFFVNQLVLRTDLSGNPDFAELLVRIRQTTLGAFAHEDLPFEKLVAELQPERAMNRAPLLQVKFDLTPAPPIIQDIAGLEISSFSTKDAILRHNLHLFMTPQGEGFLGTMAYDSSLFKAASISLLVGQYQELLSLVGARPALKLKEMVVLLNEYSRKTQQVNEERVRNLEIGKLQRVKRKPVMAESLKGV